MAPVGLIPQRTKRQTMGIVATCSVTGILLGVLLMGADIDEYGSPAIGLLVLSLVAAVVVPFIQPVALAHDPREANADAVFPGERKTLWAGLVVVACGLCYFTVPAMFVVLVSLCSRRSASWAAAALSVAVGGMMSYLVFTGITGPDEPLWREENAYTAITIMVLFLPFGVIGYYRGAARLQRLQLVELTKQAERDRIARDMHDGLSHRLSLIAVYSGALTYRQDLAPDEFARIGATIHKEAEAAVEELRGALTAVRSTTTPDATLSELIDEARTAGDVVVYRGVDLPELPSPVRQAVTRCVREAFVNARKHAPGAEVSVTVTRTAAPEVPEQPGWAAIVIRNANGGHQGAGARQGIVSMRQRMAAVGGSLAVTQGDPFELRLDIPVEV